MVQRLTYRKRHSYATKSNQTRVVKTPGALRLFVLCFEGICGVSLICCRWFLDALLFFLVWVSCRWEARLPVHQQEGERTQVPRDREEDPGGELRGTL
jgi:hypothetical protein